MRASCARSAAKREIHEISVWTKRLGRLAKRLYHSSTEQLRDGAAETLPAIVRRWMGQDVTASRTRTSLRGYTVDGTPFKCRHCGSEKPQARTRCPNAACSGPHGGGTTSGAPPHHGEYRDASPEEGDEGDAGACSDACDDALSPADGVALVAPVAVAVERSVVLEVAGAPSLVAENGSCIYYSVGKPLGIVQHGTPECGGSPTERDLAVELCMRQVEHDWLAAPEQAAFRAAAHGHLAATAARLVGPTYDSKGRLQQMGTDGDLYSLVALAVMLEINIAVFNALRPKDTNIPTAVPHGRLLNVPLHRLKKFLSHPKYATIALEWNGLNGGEGHYTPRVPPSIPYWSPPTELARVLAAPVSSHPPPREGFVARVKHALSTLWAATSLTPPPESAERMRAGFAAASPSEGQADTELIPSSCQALLPSSCWHPSPSGAEPLPSLQHALRQASSVGKALSMELTRRGVAVSRTGLRKVCTPSAHGGLALKGYQLVHPHPCPNPVAQPPHRPSPPPHPQPPTPNPYPHRPQPGRRSVVARHAKARHRWNLGRRDGVG